MLPTIRSTLFSILSIFFDQIHNFHIFVSMTSYCISNNIVDFSRSGIIRYPTSTSTMEESNRQASAKASSPASASGRRLPFTQRVYELLELTDEQSQEDIISWVNDGTAFKVHDVEKFERDLLPTYFNTQKYATFTRTLCAYGFNCVRTGRQPGICKFGCELNLSLPSFYGMLIILLLRLAPKLHS